MKKDVMSEATDWYKENNRVEVYKPKKLLKLRVIKKSWYEERHKFGQELTKAMIKRKTSGDSYLIERKIQRLEGNDIVDLIAKELQVDNADKIDLIRNKALAASRLLTNDEMEEITKLAHHPVKYMKEIHVTGRMAKKLWASDKIDDSLGGMRNDGTVAIMYGIPVIKNNDSFAKDEVQRANPTGRDEWLKEIKFIEE